jgi:hypothetical protein
MIRRRLCLGAAAVALAVPLAGCVTVHGERENVPSVRPAEAARVLAHFTAVNNEATKTYGEQYIQQIEAGPLGAIDSTGIRSAHTLHPEGAGSSTPLVLSDTKFLIPKQIGWPKFFVADSASNRATGSRWLLLFRRGSAGQPWMADYLAVVAPDALPKLATGQDGYLLPVPAAQTGLLVPPGQLSAAYSSYLQSGTGAQDFAPGGSTTQLRADRGKRARTRDSVTQYADQADSSGDFAPAALRTADGGALVFFGTRHQSKSTYRAGYNLTIDAGTRALMTGTPKTSVTLSHVGQQLATVPRAAAGGAAAGQVTFVSRLIGLVGAQGE